VALAVKRFVHQRIMALDHKARTKKMRDDFSKKTKELLASRVGFRCSNPKCQKPTSGPQIDPVKAASIGKAAHITAASPGGKRYDNKLSKTQRRAINNGIWLCSNCATLIDTDEQRYTIELLLDWKTKAEQKALAELEASSQPAGDNKSQLAKERDLGTLRLLFENMYTLAMDEFFFSGQEGYIHDNVLFYYESIRPIVTSSSFHLHDKILKRKLNSFWKAWQVSLNYSNYIFVSAPNIWVSRFIVNDKESQRQFKKFLRDVCAAEQAYRAFITYVKEKYIELDINSTNAMARSEYVQFKADVNAMPRRGRSKSRSKQRA
jgi:hypothetical protein